jgi:hypothetical protein
LEGVVDKMQRFSPIKRERNAKYSEDEEGEVSDEEYHKPYYNKMSFLDRKL